MFTIRQATGHEGQQIATVHRAARQDAMPWLPEIHSAEDQQRYFTEVLASQGCWLAEADGRIVGFMVVNQDWLDHLYIAPKFQGLAIGRQLLGKAKLLSPSGLQLWTFQRNHHARKFYAANGFVEVELTNGERNEEQTPDVRLIWSP